MEEGVLKTFLNTPSSIKHTENKIYRTCHWQLLSNAWRFILWITKSLKSFLYFSSLWL